MMDDTSLTEELGRCTALAEGGITPTGLQGFARRPGGIFPCRSVGQAKLFSLSSAALRQRLGVLELKTI